MSIVHEVCHRELCVPEQAQDLVRPDVLGNTGGLKQAVVAAEINLQKAQTRLATAQAAVLAIASGRVPASPVEMWFLTPR